MKQKVEFVSIHDTRPFKNGEGNNYRFLCKQFDDNNSPIMFDTFSKRVEDYSPGDLIEVDFKVDCREWEGKYFTNLKAVGHKLLAKADASVESTDTAHTTTPPSNVDRATSPVDAHDPSKNDDLPF